MDAIATASADGRRIVIKAVNYSAQPSAVLVRLKGSGAPARASATLHTITAGPTDSASLENPDRIAPVSRSFAYARDFSVNLEPYTVAVAEIRTE